MARSLTKVQAMLLGLFLVVCAGAGIWAMVRIGEKQGIFGEFFELMISVSDAQEVEKGTLVKIRGVEAGQVIGIDYPESDEESDQVYLRLRINKKFQDRIYSDAKASIISKGLLGTNVIAIMPGKPSAGALASGTIKATQSPSVAEISAKLYSAADRAESILKDVQESQGTLARLLKDDGLYKDFREVATDTKKMLGKVNNGVDSIQTELAGMKDFVRNGQEAIVAIKQDAEAIRSLPIIRSYVENPVGLLVRPNCTRERKYHPEKDLFEENRAVLTENGRAVLDDTANWLLANKIKDSEIVVVSFADPKNKELTSAAAKVLTEKQSEVVVQYLRDRGVHKMGWWSRRTITGLGHGIDPSPVVEKVPLPPAHTQVLLFVPES